MIKTTISIHDKYQLELKSYYPLKAGKKGTSYTINSYLFIPNNLGINPLTFPKYLFYRQIHTYIRFKTPTVILKNMAAGQDSPLQSLAENYRSISCRKDAETIKNFQNSNQLFCCILDSASRDHVELVKQKQDHDDIEELVTGYTGDVRKILKEFRNLRHIINVPSVQAKHFSLYQTADEYISLIIEKYGYELLDILQEKNKDIFLGAKPAVLKLINDEIKYRVQKGYPSVPEEEGGNETLLFRKNVFKRYMSSILYLNTRQQATARVVRQTIAGVAAGLSMIFATALAFFYQQKYGNFTLPFFMALVIGYMFKDRIKETTREYLSNRILGLFNDHQTTIYNATQKDKIGFCQEMMTFVREDKLTSGITQLRNRGSLIEEARDYYGEQVMLYRKKIRLYAKQLADSYQNIDYEGVNDITTISMDKFIQKMDDPRKTLYRTDGSEYWKVKGTKVYHLNLIVEYTSNDQIIYKRFRIVLNRTGIKRIKEYPD